MKRLTDRSHFTDMGIDSFVDLEIYRVDSSDDYSKLRAVARHYRRFKRAVKKPDAIGEWVIGIDLKGPVSDLIDRRSKLLAPGYYILYNVEYLIDISDDCEYCVLRTVLDDFLAGHPQSLDYSNDARESKRATDKEGGQSGCASILIWIIILSFAVYWLTR